MNNQYIRESLDNLANTDLNAFRKVREYILEARDVYMNKEYHKLTMYPKAHINEILPEPWKHQVLGRSHLHDLFEAVTGDPDRPLSEDATKCIYCQLPLGGFCETVILVFFACGRTVNCTTHACLMCKAAQVIQPACGRCDACSETVLTNLITNPESNPIPKNVIKLLTSDSQ